MKKVMSNAQFLQGAALCLWSHSQWEADQCVYNSDSPQITFNTGPHSILHFLKKISKIQ